MFLFIYVILFNVIYLFLFYCKKMLFLLYLEIKILIAITNIWISVLQKVQTPHEMNNK